MTMAPSPFALHVLEADLADLHERLARTRFPDPPPETSGPMARMSPICANSPNTGATTSTGEPRKPRSTLSAIPRPARRH